MKNLKKTKECQSRWFTFVLYPQCGAHMDILNFLLDEKVQEKQEFKAAGMMHDRCYYTEGLKKGFPKKSHIHVIMKTERKHTANAIAKMMGGQRIVLRLYQRDEKHEHSTKLLVPKQEEEEQGQEKQSQQSQQDQKQGGVTRVFRHETGAEYPVLVDMGYDELQPVDLDIPSELWAFISTPDGHHWDSLPKYFYNNPSFPQFKCAPNQYWKLVKRQDLAHAETISDPKAYYLYLQHKDVASLRNQKTPYDEHEFFGNQELLAELRGERGLKYQLSQLIEYFAANGVTNGKQAYEALLYGDCTEELLKFYWNHTSKFNSYFRGMEIEMMNQLKEDEKMHVCLDPDADDPDADDDDQPINYTHKHHRELAEHIQECDTKTAKRLSKEYGAIIANGQLPGKRIELADRNRLHEIEDWFALHADQKLFTVVSPEEQLFNDQLRSSVVDYYKTQASAGQEQPVQPQQYFPSSSPSPSTSSTPSPLAGVDADVAQLLGIRQIL